MKKFEIPCTPITAVKTIRFPINIIEQVEDVISGKNCTFSAFVNEAVKVALDSVKKP